jgi:hypothetical protein
MTQLRNELFKLLQHHETESGGSDLIMSPDSVQTARSGLKPGKHDGEDRLVTEHITHGFTELIVQISCLLTAITIYTQLCYRGPTLQYDFSNPQRTKSTQR